MFSAEANRVKTAPKQRKREILSELFEQSTPFTAKDFLLMPPRMEVTYEEFIIVNRYNSFFNLLKQSKLHYFYACEKLTKIHIKYRYTTVHGERVNLQYVAD